jgi:uncharacterized membrane protein
MSTIPQKLQNILDYGYSFKLGEYISKGFNLVTKELGLFVVATILMLVATAVAAFIPVVGSLLSGLILAPALTVGFYAAGRKVDLGEKLELGDFFKGFDKIGDLALTALVSGLLVLLSIVPGLLLMAFSGLNLKNIEDPESLLAGANVGLLALGGLLIFLSILFLAVSLTWSYPLVYFYNLKPMDAIRTSIKLVSKNWFMVFVFFIIVGILSGLGAVALLIGLLVTVPAMYLAQYAAFADVTQLNEPDGAQTEIFEPFTYN